MLENRRKAHDAGSVPGHAVVNLVVLLRVGRGDERQRIVVFRHLQIRPRQLYLLEVVGIIVLVGELEYVEVRL